MNSLQMHKQVRKMPPLIGFYSNEKCDADFMLTAKENHECKQKC